MKHFKFYNKKDILSLTKVRRFETKLGERLQCLPENAEWPEALAQSKAKYVLLGIPEDIGVMANYGMGSTDTAWYPFLNAFLNTQSNDFLNADEILLLGHYDFGDIKYLIENNAYNPEEKVDACRHAVHIIDEEVEQIIKSIAFYGKIPLVIGGGRNNAYPLIKAVAKGLHKSGKIPLAQINAISLSGEAGYSPAEGRHSSNAYSYAETDGYLGKYAIVGLHQHGIAQNVLNKMHDNHFIHYRFYEDIFIHERQSFIQAVAHATGFTEENFCGVELSIALIEHLLSSAHSPVGLTALQARQFISFAGTDVKAAFLHICDGACQMHDGLKSDETAKLISTLISDFVKANIA